jgi:hypothetical protein
MCIALLHWFPLGSSENLGSPSSARSLFVPYSHWFHPFPNSAKASQVMSFPNEAECERHNFLVDSDQLHLQTIASESRNEGWRLRTVEFLLVLAALATKVRGIPGSKFSWITSLFSEATQPKLSDQNSCSLLP